MTFEEYLQEQHANQYQGLDDEMCDDYNEWFETMDIDDMAGHCDKYCNDLVNNHKKVMAKLVKEHTDECNQLISLIK